MYREEQIELCKYRLQKAQMYLNDAQKTLRMEMYDTAANRSYYAIFHTVRALFALSGKDFKKHSGVISNFQQDYIKTAIFGKELSDIIKSAFLLRQESDYSDFYILSCEEVERQVTEAAYFFDVVSAYIYREVPDCEQGKVRP